MSEIRIHRPDSDDPRLRFAMLGLQVCKSLFWHDVKLPFPKDIRGASCFILRINGRDIAITAAHVIDLIREAKAANPNIIAQIMHREIDLEACLISHSARHDIATLALPPGFVDEGLIEGVLHYQAWPHPPPKKGDLAIVIGFPEIMRLSNGPTDMQFRAWAGLEIVEDVTSRQIIAVYDPARTRSMLRDTGLPPPSLNLSGASGGPVLIFEPSGEHLNIYASGVVTGGPRGVATGELGEVAVIYAARLDFMRADGEIAKDD